MLNFQFTCVSATGQDLDTLFHIIANNKPITRQTFLRHVNRDELNQIEANLGYARDFPMSKDWHVSYHKAKTLNGKPVYYFTHSAIEYVFHP